MSTSWIIAKKELASYFDSLVAYVVLIIFLAFTGIFTWLYGGDIFFRKQADLQAFFSMAYWALFFFIPALTMRLIAEERKTGTIELLLTKNVSVRSIVYGKFFSCLIMVGIALACTLPYYITVSTLGEMDHGATITGYLGLFLMSAAYIAIGLYASSMTNNQIVAFLIALTIGIFFHFLFSLLANAAPGFLGSVFNVLALDNHYDSITRGVIDSKDLIYFISIVVIALGAAELSVAKR